MRNAIVNYLKNNRKGLTPLIVAEQLPYMDDNQPLYYRNKKYIYVEVDQVEQSTALNALDGSGATNEKTLVRAFFVTDAKQPIPNYEEVVQIIKDARLTDEISPQGIIQRLCRVTPRFENDTLLTEFEFSFVKLIPK